MGRSVLHYSIAEICRTGFYAHVAARGRGVTLHPLNPNLINIVYLLTGIMIYENLYVCAPKQIQLSELATNNRGAGFSSPNNQKRILPLGKSKWEIGRRKTSVWKEEELPSLSRPIILLHIHVGLNSRNVLSFNPGAWIPRPTYQQGWFHLRPLSLACSWLPSSCLFSWSAPGANTYSPVIIPHVLE